MRITLNCPSVTPFVGVWIETFGAGDNLQKQKSHPSWVCGLKHVPPVYEEIQHESHPSWVCGLKLISALSSKIRLGHTLRGCVD